MRYFNVNVLIWIYYISHGDLGYTFSFAFEDEDAAFALLNDDLKYREYENVALQVHQGVYETRLQRCLDQTHDLIVNSHVPRANDRGIDNIAKIIEKNTTPEEDEFYEYPYYIARIHRRFIIPKR